MSEKNKADSAYAPNTSDYAKYKDMFHQHHLGAPVYDEKLKKFVRPTEKRESEISDIVETTWNSLVDDLRTKDTLGVRDLIKKWGKKAYNLSQEQPDENQHVPDETIENYLMQTIGRATGKKYENFEELAGDIMNSRHLSLTELGDKSALKAWLRLYAANSKKEYRDASASFNRLNDSKYKDLLLEDFKYVPQTAGVEWSSAAEAIHVLQGAIEVNNRGYIAEPHGIQYSGSDALKQGHEPKIHQHKK